MSYYRTCPKCGSNLDPGEVCDCQEGKLRHCHELLDRLDSPDLVARAYRFIQYLYTYGDKKEVAQHEQA